MFEWEKKEVKNKCGLITDPELVRQSDPRALSKVLLCVRIRTRIYKSVCVCVWRYRVPTAASGLFYHDKEKAPVHFSEKEHGIHLALRN